MKAWKKAISVALVATMATASLSACGKKSEEKKSDTPASTNSGESTKNDGGNKKLREYTLFNSSPGKEIPADNRMYKLVNETVGAKATITFLTGQTAKERIGVMIAGGEYPDLIEGGDATADLVANGALITLEDKLDKYPNIKNSRSEQAWNMVKGAGNGHIYYIPIYGNVMGTSMQCEQNDEAFWLQKRVLKWANWPTIKTVDSYFQTIQDYLAANPKDAEGQDNIGFEILCDDWRWFCLENVPQFLAGYPNDGAAIVDPDTLEAKNYDNIPEAKRYYLKLNEMFNAGVIDPETFTMNYDQYKAKLATGVVCGMVDQGWDFNEPKASLISQHKEECTYVPLGLTFEEGQSSQYFCPPALNTGGGLAITKSCKDVDGALQFINDMMSEEVMIMRTWGQKDVDYHVDENGLFYRDEEQRENWKNPDWCTENQVNGYYNLFPVYSGMMPDGINAWSPSEQPSEFKATLSDVDKEVLDAYGYTKWTDFLTYTPEVGPWYPIYTVRNTWESSSDAAIASQKIEDVKREWLPKVIMAKPEKAEETWNKYMDHYEKDTNYKVFEEALTKGVKERSDIANGTAN